MLKTIQDQLLAELTQNETFLLIYLKNGIKLSGRMAGYNKDAIFIKDPILQIVYKASISTIVFQ